MLKNIAKKTLLPQYQKYIRKLHELNYIFFELTNKCNLNCLHCGSDCVRDPKVPDLPVKSIIKVLEEIKTKFDPHKTTVVLSGGEPLVYPELFSLGKKIYDLEFPWGMVTNGFGWSEKKVYLAQETGLRSITISLDGLEEDHDWLRGRKTSFQKAVKAIKLFVKNPFYQAMDVISCVNKRTIKKLDELYQYIVDLGVKQWRLFMISPIGRAVETPELFLNADEFKYLMDKVLEFKEKNEIRVNYSESGYLGPKYEHHVRDHNYFCLAGISVAGIMVNGDILACPNIDRRFKQGNIHEDSFLDVWENKYQEFRNRNWMKTGECKNCKDWNLCQGNSFHLWDLDHNCPKICHIKDFQLE